MSAEEAHALALLQAERDAWERDQQAIAEYEHWHTTRENDAHTLGEQ